MQGLIPDNTIEEIKQRADIVDVISEYVTLKKAGKNFLGICPFHTEKTPSFTVSREKQMFYCFGCGAGGHVFTFLMKMSNMSFPEAARYLAKKTGVVISERALSYKEKLQYGIHEQINRVNEIAAAYFVENLSSAPGETARKYLRTRGIGDDVVRDFRLGYAEDSWRSLRNYFERQKIPLALVAQAGLVISRKEGETKEDFYDRFRGRLIFPIEDAAGRVVAFGGRVIGQGEPKYLNSPETPVFSKGKNLYGLNKARDDIRKSGYAILVEGYFDLIALRNVGMDNVLATLGTALTKDHVNTLRRYTGHVAVLFDADEAGRKALERSLQLFLGGGVQAKAVVLPEGYDPDDYVRKFGRGGLENIINRAPFMVDYYIENIVGHRAALEEKRNAAKDAIAFISGLDDAIERNLFLKRVSEKLGIDEDVLKKEAVRSFSFTSASSTKSIREKPLGNAANKDKVELSLIFFMLEHPESMVQVKESAVMDYFSDNDLRNLGMDMIAMLDEDTLQKLTASSILERIAEGPLKERLLNSLFEERPDDKKLMARFLVDAIKKIKSRWYKKSNKSLLIELTKAQEKGDSDLLSRLLLEKEKLLKEEKLIW